MARERSPNRDKAYELWKQSGGNMLLKDIAAQLGVSDIQVRKWKNQDQWDESEKVTLPISKGNVTNGNGNVTNEPDTFPGQCTAISSKTGQRCRQVAVKDGLCRYHKEGRENQCTAKSKQTGERCRRKAVPGKDKCKFHGGMSTGPSEGTQNALKHGFFAKIFPDDEETRALVDEIMEKSPLDILWENIMIQYLAIARAQKIMFVKDRDDLTEYLKREKETSGLHSDGWEKEYELQFAWDKQANFLKAQSAAMKTLDGLITRYEEMIQKGNASKEHQLRLEKMKQDMLIAQERLQLEKAKVMGDPDETEDDGFIEALSGKVGEAWDGYAGEDQE